MEEFQEKYGKVGAQKVISDARKVSVKSMIEPAHLALDSTILCYDVTFHFKRCSLCRHQLAKHNSIWSCLSK